MTARSLALSAGLLLLAPAVAAAQPTTIFNGDAWRAGPVSAPGGGAFTPSNQQVVAFAKRSGDGLAASETAFKAPEFETVWGAGLDARGAGVILTLRRHKPYQRARVSFRSADGTVTPSKTISAKGHSASGPALAVARDGSAIAAWAWHDPAGWVVQAATRPAGGQFGAPQTLSSAQVSRPFITLAVGEGGDAVAAWQYGGSYKEPEEPLMYAIAPAGQAFGAAAKLADGGGHSELDIAVGADGRMLASWQPTYFLTRGDKEPAKLFVADRASGEGFGAPRQLNSGGPGFVDQGGPT